MKIFLSGPIDLKSLEFVKSYRIRYRKKLQKLGFEVIEPYSMILEKFNVKNLTDLLKVDFDDPYVKAFKYFIANSEDKDLKKFSRVISDDHVKGIVERDLNLIKEVDILVAYLPEQSMGTMAEIIKAQDYGKDVYVFNENESTITTFVRYYSDKIFYSFKELKKYLNDKY